MQPFALVDVFKGFISLAAVLTGLVLMCEPSLRSDLANGCTLGNGTQSCGDILSHVKGLADTGRWLLSTGIALELSSGWAGVVNTSMGRRGAGEEEEELDYPHSRREESEESSRASRTSVQISPPPSGDH